MGAAKVHVAFSITAAGYRAVSTRCLLAKHWRSPSRLSALFSLPALFNQQET